MPHTEGSSFRLEVFLSEDIVCIVGVCSTTGVLPQYNKYNCGSASIDLLLSLSVQQPSVGLALTAENQQVWQVDQNKTQLGLKQHKKEKKEQIQHFVDWSHWTKEEIDLTRQFQLLISLCVGPNVVSRIITIEQTLSNFRKRHKEQSISVLI